MPLPSRKRPAQGVLIQANQPTIVFVTACTKDRRPWLADPEIHRLLRNVWAESSAWRVGRYVIMPEHIHFFCAPGLPELPLSNWVKYWKSKFTQQHDVAEHRWQAGAWDTRLRRAQSYDEKWEYVRNNPVRHRLVETPENWPYQGELNVLPW